MKPLSIFVALLCLTARAPLVAGSKEAPRAEFPKAAWYLLDDARDFPSPFREATPAVVAAVKAQGLDPNRYFVRLEYGAEPTVIKFQLWYLGMFPLDYSAKGDPTHKCRTVEYDTGKKAVRKIYGWR